VIFTGTPLAALSLGQSVLRAATWWPRLRRAHQYEHQSPAALSRLQAVGSYRRDKALFGYEGIEVLAA
jgi:hypothetical protein